MENKNITTHRAAKKRNECENKMSTLFTLSEFQQLIRKKKLNEEFPRFFYLRYRCDKNAKKKKTEGQKRKPENHFFFG